MNLLGQSENPVFLPSNLKLSYECVNLKSHLPNHKPFKRMERIGQIRDPKNRENKSGKYDYISRIACHIRKSYKLKPPKNVLMNLPCRADNKPSPHIATLRVLIHVLATKKSLAKDYIINSVLWICPFSLHQFVTFSPGFSRKLSQTATRKWPFPWFHLRSHRHILHVTQEPGHGIRDEGGLRFAPGAAGDVGILWLWLTVR